MGAPRDPPEFRPEVARGPRQDPVPVSAGAVATGAASGMDVERKALHESKVGVSGARRDADGPFPQKRSAVPPQASSGSKDGGVSDWGLGC